MPDEYRSHRPVDRVLELRERNDLVEPLPDVRPAQAVDRPIEKDVLSSREVGVEPRAELEQRADPALRPHPAGRGLDDPGDDTEQRRLARPVAPDETDGFAARDTHRHVMERPDVLGLARPRWTNRSLSVRVSRAWTWNRRETPSTLISPGPYSDLD